MSSFLEYSFGLILILLIVVFIKQPKDRYDEDIRGERNAIYYL